MFSVHENKKPALSNSSGLKRVFGKLSFRGGFSSVDGRPLRRNKLRFQGLRLNSLHSAKFIQITQLAREVNVRLSQNTRLKVKGYIFSVLIERKPLHRPCTLCRRNWKMKLYVTVRLPSKTLFKSEKFEKAAFAIECEGEIFCKRRF